VLVPVPVLVRELAQEQVQELSPRLLLQMERLEEEEVVLQST
jgi:hypothetical protein